MLAAKSGLRPPRSIPAAHELLGRKVQRRRRGDGRREARQWNPTYRAKLRERPKGQSEALLYGEAEMMLCKEQAAKEEMRRVRHWNKDHPSKRPIVMAELGQQTGAT